MNETDKKYKPMYKQQLAIISEILDKEINTEEDENGDFIDKRVSFGYAIFVLERTRVDKVLTELQSVAEKGFEEMFQLGKMSEIENIKSERCWRG